jgi:hypothetical protein
MTDHRPTTAAAIRSVLEDNAPTGEHLSLESLFAYRRQALPSADRQAAQEHLSDCPQCAELLLDLDAFDAPELPQDRHLWEDDLRTVEQRLRQDRQQKNDRERSDPPARGWGFWAGYALAATLLIATVGLTVRLAMQQELLETPRSFQPFDWDLEQRSAETPPILPLTATDDGLALYIYPDSTDAYPEYALRLEQPQGTEVWRREGLRAGRGDPIRLFLPRAALPPGTSVLRLFGQDGARLEEIRTTTIEIRHPP